MKKYLAQWLAACFVIIGMFAGPVLGRAEAAEQTAGYAPIDLKNATYTIEAMVTGNGGIGTIQTPTSIFVKEKKATVVLIWDTPAYDYMVVDGEKILAKSREGGSIFWIPVTGWDEEIQVIVGCETGTMKEEVCSLYLDTSTVKKQGNNGPLYFLIVLNIILAFLNALNMVRKRKLFVERVETKEEAEKFAKQQAKKPMQPNHPQKRLVLDENGNFVTSDVFESAKVYKAGEEGTANGASAPQTPPVPPQDAPAPQLWWRRTGEETLIIDRKDDGYRVKEIRPVKPAAGDAEKEQEEKEATVKNGDAK